MSAVANVNLKQSFSNVVLLSTTILARPSHPQLLLTQHTQVDSTAAAGEGANTKAGTSDKKGEEKSNSSPEPCFKLQDSIKEHKEGNKEGNKEGKENKEGPKEIQVIDSLLMA